MKILVINGPNINMLGIREPAIYGDRNYEALINQINVWGAELHAEVECYQSNHEGDIVDKIQDALGKFDGIVTSVAILDALKAVSIPACEVHISDVNEREKFRHISYAGMACEAHFIGLGFDGYKKAMEYLCEKYK